VICMFAGYLANHDRTHIPRLKEERVESVKGECVI
jgi:hypothetical protein